MKPPRMAGPGPERPRGPGRGTLIIKKLTPSPAPTSLPAFPRRRFCRAGKKQAPLFSRPFFPGPAKATRRHNEAERPNPPLFRGGQGGALCGGTHRAKAGAQKDPETREEGPAPLLASVCKRAGPGDPSYEKPRTRPGAARSQIKARAQVAKRIHNAPLSDGAVKFHQKSQRALFDNGHYVNLGRSFLVGFCVSHGPRNSAA